MKNIHILFTLCFLFLSIGLVNAQCVEESHSPFKEQGWYSCQTSTSVIPERGDRHWILYDLGDKFVMHNLMLWNHNVWGDTGSGVKSLLIDYSTDMTNWSTIGPIDVERAPGSWAYTAEEPTDLNDVIARYVLFTVVDTYDDSECAGLGEIKMKVTRIVGADDFEENQIKDLYPNPAREFVRIELESYEDVIEMNITNNVGQIISRLSIPTDSKVEIPIYDLHDGMYFINVKSRTGNSSTSFVKI